MNKIEEIMTLSRKISKLKLMPPQITGRKAGAQHE